MSREELDELWKNSARPGWRPFRGDVQALLATLSAIEGQLNQVEAELKRERRKHPDPKLYRVDL